MSGVILRFALLVLGFTWLAQGLALPAWLGLTVGGLLGFAVTAYYWYRKKDQVYTAKVLAAKPFGMRVPDEVDLAFDTSVALAGDDSYSQTVAGSWHYLQNFGELRNLADVPEGEVLEVQAALVIEPANQHSRHAVVVSVAGFVVGYIPEFESEPLFRFLQDHRGIARVNCNVHLTIASGQPKVELDLTRPFQIVSGV
jgi:hypothetical protein